MTTTHCPSCYEPVAVAPHAREGRCDACRPKRKHSQPKPPLSPEHAFARLVAQHQRNYTQ